MICNCIFKLFVYVFIFIFFFVIGTEKPLWEVVNKRMYVCMYFRVHVLSVLRLMEAYFSQFLSF